MNSEIVKTLKVMCNQEDPQDQKLLLLAELVETKCEALAQHQDALQKSLDKTNEKLDKVTDLLEKIESEETAIPRLFLEKEKSNIIIVCVYNSYEILLYSHCPYCYYSCG